MSAQTEIFRSAKLDSALQWLLDALSEDIEVLGFCERYDFPEYISPMMADPILMASDPERLLQEGYQEEFYKTANDEQRIGFDRMFFMKTALIYTLQAKAQTTEIDCWSLVANAMYYLGLYEGNILIPTPAAVRQKTAQQAAQAANAENIQMLAEAFKLLNGQEKKQTKAASARLLMAHFPIKQRTAEAWVKKWYDEKVKLPKVLILID